MCALRRSARTRRFATAESDPHLAEVVVANTFPENPGSAAGRWLRGHNRMKATMHREAEDQTTAAAAMGTSLTRRKRASAIKSFESSSLAT